MRPLTENDLDAANQIFRLAFGTHLRLPDPLQFFGDAEYVRTRWLANPSSAFAAEVDGKLVASQFVTSWGSVGFFGPLTVHPDYWGMGIAKRLMAPTMELFAKWGTTHEGLFTFADSAKHIGLYHKFGFWPRFLTAVMATPARTNSRSPAWTRFSDIRVDSRPDTLRACADLTGAIYPGLDVSREIRAVEEQHLGETVLLYDGEQLTAIAVCHCGPGTEAGSGACYVKFGAVRPSPSAPKTFNALLDACHKLAFSRGLVKLVAGANMAREETYRIMARRGFRTEMQGVAMERSGSGYNGPSVYLIDDWR